MRIILEKEAIVIDKDIMSSVKDLVRYCVHVFHIQMQTFQSMSDIYFTIILFHIIYCQVHKTGPLIAWLGEIYLTGKLTLVQGSDRVPIFSTDSRQIQTVHRGQETTNHKVKPLYILSWCYHSFMAKCKWFQLIGKLMYIFTNTHLVINRDSGMIL